MITLTFRFASGEGVPALESHGRTKLFVTRVTEETHALTRVTGGWVIGGLKPAAEGIRFPLTFAPDALVIVEGDASDFARLYGYAVVAGAATDTKSRPSARAQ